MDDISFKVENLLLAPRKVKKGVGLIPYTANETNPAVAYNAKIDALDRAAPSEPTSNADALDLRVSSSRIAAVETSHACTISSATTPSSTAGGGDRSPTPASETQSAPARVEREPFIFPLPAGPLDAPHRVFYANIMTAQQHFGPEARVIVGNLPNRATNSVLDGTVQAAFSRYGKCWACVFRGHGEEGMKRPYAVVQYTKEMDAAAAFCCGQQMDIRGRAARVEKSVRA